MQEDLFGAVMDGEVVMTRKQRDEVIDAMTLAMERMGCVVVCLMPDDVSKMTQHEKNNLTISLYTEAYAKLENPTEG